jgi:hypothetical protein
VSFLADYLDGPVAFRVLQRAHPISKSERLMSKALLLFSVSLIIAIATESSAQTSHEYALMGQKLWATFECSQWASYADDKDEEVRLFKLGYGQGREFVEAAWSNKLNRQDLSDIDIAPSEVQNGLDGPSVDFVLGRIYEKAYHKVSNLVPSDSVSEGKAFSQQRLREKNCRLLM